MTPIPPIPEELRGYHADATKGLAEHENWKDCFVKELIERIAKLTAEVERLTWQEITPENIPNRGDEVLELPTATHGAKVIPVGFDAREGDFERYTHAGFTHFRAINPPASRATRTPPQEGQ